MGTTRYNADAMKPTRERLAAGVAAFGRSTPAQVDLASVYDDTDRAIAGIGGTCLGGGACCRFDLLDHRVWLTTAELGGLLSEAPSCEIANELRCPYQLGPDCTARARRPLSCRTFFCRPPDRDRLQDLHQVMHRRIAVIHQTHCIPYVYAELGEAVMQLSTAKRLNVEPGSIRAKAFLP